MKGKKSGSVEVVVVPTPAPAVLANKKRRKRKKRAQNIAPGSLTQPNRGSATPLIRRMNALMGKCELDDNEHGWTCKYVDPCGSSEIGQATGEFSKIPDGLLQHSVDAEIRSIIELNVPGSEQGVISLEGLNWSFTIVSPVCYRTAFFILANTRGEDVSDVISRTWAEELNNLVNPRSVIDQGWQPLGVENWYYRIESLPPTYAMPEPVASEVQTVTAWRCSYKGFTVMDNSPNLLNQGWIVGGNYALEATPQTLPTGQTLEVPSFITAVTRSGFDDPAQISIPNFPQREPTELTYGSNWDSVRAFDGTTPSFFSFNIANPPPLGSGSISLMLRAGESIYTSLDEIFADSLDTVSFDRPNTASVTITSTRAGTSPIVIDFPLSGAFPGLSASVSVLLNLPENTEARELVSKTRTFPALSYRQIAANNPKMAQFRIKNAGGVYIVQSKMLNPVFEMTNAETYGPIQWLAPGSDVTRFHNDGSGVQDTFDSNFSTAVVSVRSISHANAMVIKLYQGWEGVTNTNTMLGQFAHAGHKKHPALMDMLDTFNSRMSGVYPANWNFLSTITNLIGNLLGGLFKSEATPSVINQGAHDIADKAAEALLKLLNKIGN